MKDIIEKIEADQRIDTVEALELFHKADLLTMGRLANDRRFRFHPEKRITFVVDRNINYTNVCVSGCRFCAFYAVPGADDGYLLTRAQLGDKIQETLDMGGTQILLQGGMHPDFEIDFYVDMLKFIKNNYEIHIHGFSPQKLILLPKNRT